MSQSAEGVPTSQNPAANLWGRLVETGFAVLDAKLVQELEDVEILKNPDPPQYNRIHHQDETRQNGQALPSAFSSLFTMQNLQGAAFAFAAVTLGVILIKKV